jgi:hypothetical protein
MAISVAIWAKPERPTAWVPESPRLSSTTETAARGHPRLRALSTSAYWRRVDSVLFSTCAREDCRIDDCNIYVRSRRAGERVMASVSRFLTTKLRLTVNEAKSAVARPEERKFLGFSISNDGSERRIAPKALDKFKMQIPTKSPTDSEMMSPGWRALCWQDFWQVAGRWSILWD